MESKNEGIKSAIEQFNGSQAELAKQIQVSRAQVWQWLNNVNSISTEKAIAIEEATNGKVRCEDLRPDVNWAVLRKRG